MNIAALVLIGTALVALVPAVLLRRKLARPGGRMALCAVAAIVVGSWLVIVGSGEIATARAVKKWPTTQGTVLQSEIIGDRAIRPVIVYQYRVGDSTFSDSSSLGIPSFGNRRSRRNESEMIAAEYRVGDTVNVYYDPGVPAHSTLYAREDWSSYLRLSLGTLLFGAGMFFLIGAGLGRRSSAPR